jgi:hypothetical protein
VRIRQARKIMRREIARGVDTLDDSAYSLATLRHSVITWRKRNARRRAKWMKLHNARVRKICKALDDWMIGF